MGLGWEQLAPSSQSSRAPWLGWKLSFLISCITLVFVLQFPFLQMRPIKVTALRGGGKPWVRTCAQSACCHLCLDGLGISEAEISAAGGVLVNRPLHTNCRSRGLSASYKSSGGTAIPLIGPRGKQAAEKGLAQGHLPCFHLLP